MSSPQLPICIGLDPGVGGAIAFIHPSGEAEVIDMPKFEPEVRGTKRQKNYVDAHGVARVLRPYRELDCYALVEEVHAMPQNGCASSFNFGGAFRVLEGVLAAFCIPYMLSPPTEWKVIVGKINGTKADSVNKAIQLFPELTMQLKPSRSNDKTGKDGRAEALLMAYFLQQRIALGEIRWVPRINLHKRILLSTD